MKRYADARLHFFKENESEARLFFEAILQPPASLEEEIREVKKEFDCLNKKICEEAHEINLARFWDFLLYGIAKGRRYYDTIVCFKSAGGRNSGFSGRKACIKTEAAVHPGLADCRNNSWSSCSGAG